MTNPNEHKASSTNLPTPSPQRAMVPSATVGQNGPNAGAHKPPESEVAKAASQLAEDARDLGSQVKTSARELVTSEVEKRTSQGADDLSDVARALRESGRELDGNMAGPYVQKAAEKIDDFSLYLRTATPTRVLASVKGFAAREPLLFLGGAFALGLVGSRFMKSGHSSPAEPDRSSGQGAR